MTIKDNDTVETVYANNYRNRLTRSILLELEPLIVGGLPLDKCAAMVGLSPTYLSRCLLLGRERVFAYDDYPQDPSILIDLFNMVSRARAESVQNALDKLHTVTDEVMFSDPKLASSNLKWLLERFDKEAFSLRDSVKLVVDGRKAQSMFDTVDKLESRDDDDVRVENIIDLSDDEIRYMNTVLDTDMKPVGAKTGPDDNIINNDTAPAPTSDAGFDDDELTNNTDSDTVTGNTLDDIISNTKINDDDIVND